MRKEETVERLVAAFEESTVVFGMRFQKTSVKQLEGVRRALPPGAKLIVCKNKLMKKAAERAGDWAAIDPAAKARGLGGCV